MIWKTTEDELLLSLWRKGLSSSEISAQIGRTRNSVIGRVHRLRDMGHDVSARERIVIKNKKKIEEKIFEDIVKDKEEKNEEENILNEIKNNSKKTNPIKGDFQSVSASALARSLLNLKHNQCRWPLETFFCKNKKISGQPYCEHHRALAFRSTSTTGVRP